jgi:hypothetical protein
MTTLIPDEEELLDRAYRAYYLRCQREGWAYQIPASAKSLVQGNRVVLRNCNGVLAIFDITKDGKLKWLEKTEARLRYYNNY